MCARKLAKNSARNQCAIYIHIYYACNIHTCCIRPSFMALIQRNQKFEKRMDEKLIIFKHLKRNIDLWSISLISLSVSRTSKCSITIFVIIYNRGFEHCVLETYRIVPARNLLYLNTTLDIKVCRRKKKDLVLGRIRQAVCRLCILVKTNERLSGATECGGIWR